MKKIILLLAFISMVVSVSAQVSNGNNPSNSQIFEEGNTTLSSIPFVDLAIRSPEDNREVAISIQLLLFLTILTLSPSLLVLLTSFLRISIVLDFVKRALSLQQVPPNSVILGISLFITAFVMWPVFTDMYDNGFKPFSDGQINTSEMLDEVESPIRLFMYKQMNGKHENISLFMSLRELPAPNSLEDVPTHILIPAFVLNEITIAFQMGILIYIPFIIIDMIVASTLMSMGMIMLPPVMISMPFKLILFIAVDGWGLIVKSLVRSIL